MNLNKLNFNEIKKIKEMLLRGVPNDVRSNLWYFLSMIQKASTSTFKELLNSKLKQVTKNKHN